MHSSKKIMFIVYELVFAKHIPNIHCSPIFIFYLGVYLKIETLLTTRFFLLIFISNLNPSFHKIPRINIPINVIHSVLIGRHRVIFIIQYSHYGYNIPCGA